MVIIVSLTWEILNTKCHVRWPSQINNSEESLAMGKKMDLFSATTYDLSLVSGISADIAERLYSKKEDLIFKARKLPIGQKHLVLEDIKGIGVKKSRLFSQYISLEND